MIKILDHIARAIARLVSQYVGKPKMEALVSVPAGRVQTLEDAFWDVLTKRLNIDVAFGAQLDGIGAIVGQAREGLSDIEYRIRLKARIRTNLSEGSIEEVIAVLSILEPSLVVRVLEQFPAGIVARLEGGEAHSPDILASVLRKTKAGGVRAILEYESDTDENTFCFENGPGLGFGAGKFAGAK